MITSWNGKPYHSLDYMLRERFREKVYKVTLNGGMSCPNRDGTIGHGGCIFCSAGGSGDFAASASLSITEQIRQQIQMLSAKRPIHKYIAYFQDYSNTYAPADTLRPLFLAAIDRPEICALSIATRPDCLPPEILALLSELRQKKPVWVELGLQTVHASTARYIRRGYPLSIFDNAVQQLKGLDLHVIAHMILGLPGETLEMMVQTAHHIGQSGADGIKLHLLHVLSGTDLAEEYAAGAFETMPLEAYISALESCLRVLPREMVIHRMTGDGAKRSLIAPLWSADKKRVLNAINRRFLSDNLEQGSALVDGDVS